MAHDIHIPPAALEAGARAAYDQWRHECADEVDEAVENYREWDDLDEWEQDSFRAQSRAALAAGLAAWPGMFEEYMNDEDGGGASVCVILPQEASDE